LTESPRHANTIRKIKTCLIELRASIWENSDERGVGGWKLPPIMFRHQIVEFTLDIFARLASGAMVVFEVDYQMKGSPKAASKMLQRDAILKQFGITTIRLTPKMVDGMTAAHLQEEIDYWLLGKRPLEAMT